MLEAAHDAILVTDAEGRVLHYNDRYTTLWHLSKEAVAKTSHRELFEFIAQRLADPTSFAAQIQEIYASDQDFSDELLLTDGAIVERFSKVQHLGGRPIGRV